MLLKKHVISLSLKFKDTTEVIVDQSGPNKIYIFIDKYLIFTAM